MEQLPFHILIMLGRQCLSDRMHYLEKEAVEGGALGCG